MRNQQVLEGIPLTAGRGITSPGRDSRLFDCVGELVDEIVSKSPTTVASEVTFS